MTISLRQTSGIQAYMALLAGVAALTLSPMFVHWAEAPGLVTSFYKMGLAAVVLTPLVLWHGRKRGWPARQAFLFPIAAGFFSALDHGFWSTAIGKTTVANATLLNNISPLWVALFAVLIWREQPKKRFWLGLLAIFIGVSMVLGSTLLIRPAFAGGDTLAAFSSFFYAGFYLVTQKGRRWMNTLFYLWAFSLTGGTFLFIGTRLFGYAIIGYSSFTYLNFVMAALIAQLGAYTFITFALGTLPASVVTPTMVLQPVLTALIAIPFAGEQLLLAQAAGGGLTLAGVFLVNTSVVLRTQAVKGGLSGQIRKPTEARLDERAVINAQPVNRDDSSYSAEK